MWKRRKSTVNGKRSIRENSIQGSYTVEVALLFPVILFVILALLYLSFFLYDRNILENSAQVTLYRLQEEKGLSNKEMLEQVQKFAVENVNSRLIAMEDPKVEVTVTTQKVSVYYLAEMKVPEVVFLTDTELSQNWKLRIGSEISRIDGVNVIRRYRKIKEFYEFTQEMMKETEEE